MGACPKIPPDQVVRDKDDLPYAKTVLAIGDGAIEPIHLERTARR